MRAPDHVLPGGKAYSKPHCIEKSLSEVSASLHKFNCRGRSRASWTGFAFFIDAFRGSCQVVIRALADALKPAPGVTAEAFESPVGQIPSSPNAFCRVIDLRAKYPANENRLALISTVGRAPIAVTALLVDSLATFCDPHYPDPAHCWQFHGQLSSSELERGFRSAFGVLGLANAQPAGANTQVSLFLGSTESASHATPKVFEPEETQGHRNSNRANELNSSASQPKGIAP